MYDLDKSNRNIKSNSSSYYDDKKYEEHGSTFDDDPNDYSNDYSNRYSDDIYRTEAERRSAGSNYKSTNIVTLLTWVVVFTSIFGGGVYLYKFSSDLEKDKKTRYTLEKPKNNKKTKKDNVTSSRPKWNNLKDDFEGIPVSEEKNTSSSRPRWSNLRDDIEGVSVSEEKNTSSSRPRWNNLRDDIEGVPVSEEKNTSSSRPRWNNLRDDVEGVPVSEEKNTFSSRARWNNLRDDIEGNPVSEKKNTSSSRPRWNNLRDDIEGVIVTEEMDTFSLRTRWNNVGDDLVYSQEDETSNVSNSRTKKNDFWSSFQGDSKDNNKSRYLVTEEERNQKSEIEPVKKIDNKFNFNQERLFTDNSYSDLTYLYEKRDYFLALPEKDLIDNFTNIYNFVTRRLTSKSTDERVYNVLKIVFFLKIAIDKDYPNLLKEILDKKFEINSWKFNYLPVLFYVADKDSRKCLDVLIDKETDLRTQLEYKPGQVCYISKNNSRPDGKTLYLFRALLSKSEVNSIWYESIINLEKDVFEKIDDDKIEYVLDLGKTLLHSAAQNGNISLAKKVLEAGVNIDSPTFRFKKTPLYFAVANNKYEMVKFLVENGAKVDEQTLKLNINSDMAKILEKR